MKFKASKVVWVLALFVLVACGATPVDPPTATPPPLPTAPSPTAPPTATTEPAPTATVAAPTPAPAEPTPAEPSPAETGEGTGTSGNGLQTYTNAEYGFSLCYPATWTAADVNGADFIVPGSHSVQLSQGTALLAIGYRRAGTGAPILATGGPAGDDLADARVTIAGRGVVRHTIVLDGRVQAVFYDPPGSVFPAGDLEFSFRLDDFTQDEIDIPQQVQDEADLILSSLTLGSDTVHCAGE